MSYPDNDQPRSNYTRAQGLNDKTHRQSAEYTRRNASQTHCVHTDYVLSFPSLRLHVKPRDGNRFSLSASALEDFNSHHMAEAEVCVCVFVCVCVCLLLGSTLITLIYSRRVQTALPKQRYGNTVTLNAVFVRGLSPKFENGTSC